ncbi:YggS family pyridoxal phosphate-dependent enzyme [Aestuariibacter salexigens]|uniref:YggS family pyridoxal phosphate-dependent enzyme n=1 Tax=Aestuariibacter salexigens TaxID=226010 RepID=UPI000427B760|nr:YggS family pyridoxal phosphate-dependent enzyme [Aestuariibacter salexigens]
MKTIAERLKTARDYIERTTIDAHRPTKSVQLLAVSKTKPVSDIEQAYEAGQRLFGENYVQEGVDKVQALEHLSDIEWHFIGPLQSNKTRLVAEHFDWFQALDREKIARRLHEQRSPHKSPLNVTIQVNIDDEHSKSGVSPDDVMALADAIQQYPRIVLRGLMAIPKADSSDAQQYASFSNMLALFERLKQQYQTADTLSMGMSSDWQQAIIHGSTMIRLGTAIFGPRQ